jgi:hypothetical protein
MEAFCAKGRFSRVRRLKTPWPINTKLLTYDYCPNIMLQINFHNNRPKVFVCPQWWRCTFCVTPVFFHFLSRVSSGTRRSICQAYVSNDVACLKAVPFRGLIDEKFFQGEYPFPRIFKGHFTCKSKKSDNFWFVRDRRKIPKPTYTKLGSRNRLVRSLPV